MVAVAEAGRKEYEVVETALRDYLHRDSMPTLDGWRRRREELLAIADRHGARNVRILGSIARGEGRSDSDVDFLVDIEPGRSLLDLSSLILDLEDALGREVNVVEISRPSAVADRIVREAIPL